MNNIREWLYASFVLKKVVTRGVEGFKTDKSKKPKLNYKGRYNYFCNIIKGGF